MEIELASVSTRLDGRASIEHQIDIHVADLTLIENIPEISLDDVLQGLKYVMDYRIKGGKMRNLDLDLMRRLLEALMQHMAGKQGSLMNQRPTAEANLALVLFGEFLEDVDEFRIAVSEKSSTDLRHALKIHRRCQPNSDEKDKEFAASILALLTKNFAQFSDWRELVKEREHNDVERLIEQFKDRFNQPAMPPLQNVNLLFPPQVLFFDKNVDKLAEMYGSSVKAGLSTDRYRVLKDYYGVNKLPEPPKPSIPKMILSQVLDFMIIVLIIVAAVEAGLGDYDACGIIFAVVVMNVVIGFSQEYKANQALEALMSLSVQKASVIRDGEQETVDASTLVPGDLVVLEEGDAIAADLRICESSQLEIIEAILTGESVPASKGTKTIRKRTRKLPLGDCRGNAFMSTVVAKGRGKGLVVRIGEDTEIGKISKAITSQPQQQTSIQKKLSVLGKWLVAIAVLLCALVVVIGVAWKRKVSDMVQVGVSLAVSVIPEGLVAVVTVTMAIGVSRMASLNAIVRKLPSVETLGSVQIICSDKTGTLTEGKMGTSEIWASDNSKYSFTDSTSLDPQKGNANILTHENIDIALSAVASPTSAATVLDEAPKTIERAPFPLILSSMIAALCNNASVVLDQETKDWKPIGDPTEVAMVVAAQKSGFSREFFHDKIGLTKIGEFAFDSERKMMSVIYKQGPRTDQMLPSVFNNSSCFIMAKGAPEGILSKSTHYLASPNSNKSVFDFVENTPDVPMSNAFLQLVSRNSSRMAESGLRVLALAIRKVSLVDAQSIYQSKKSTESEQNLTFVGLIGLIDPPKAGVADSVASCRRAGIKVVMITGDHIATASAIARQLGIIDPARPSECRAMKGYEVDLLSEEALASLVPFPVVFARVSPDNKLKIVKALQSKKLAVAMTGDGVNDAPAIKKADVGVAMGIGGTEITKQAADIVLADDNFTTIVAAVKEGRRVFDNIKKFVVYLLSCNSAEIFLFLGSACLNLDVPFNVMQILWANIIADIPPAMSLGVEPFEKDIMDRPPRPGNEGVLPRLAAIVVLCQGLIQSMLTLGVYIFATDTSSWLIKPENAFLAPSHPSLLTKQSLAFATLTSMQLVQSFLSKSVSASFLTTGLGGNKWMIGAFLLSFSLLVAGFYIPGLNKGLFCVPLPAMSWAVVAICISMQVVLVESLKVVVRIFERRQKEKLMTVVENYVQVA